MKRFTILLGLGLILLILAAPYSLASSVLVPNGSFENGTLGLIPDHWNMVTWNTNELSGGVGSTYINEAKQIDSKYFEGQKSLWLHSRVIDTDGLKQGRGSETCLETEEWVNAPLATHVRIYIRDIESTHSLFWGWDNSINLAINNVSVAETWAVGQYWGFIFTHGETLNWNLYNYTATGSDGQNWHVYEYSIPSSVDKTHMKIQIVGVAWDWTFYNTNYYSDLEFAVDKVELLLAPPLSASIDPLSASTTVGHSLTFNSTISGGAPPYSYQWYLDSNPVSGATFSSWTFTPTTSGIHHVYLNVTDAIGTTVQSDAARITAGPVPVGGFSFSVGRNTGANPLTPYFAFVVISAVMFTAIKCRHTRMEKNVNPLCRSCNCCAFGCAFPKQP